MATKTFKIGLSNTDKQNMAQEVYERLLALTFPEYDSAESYDVGDFVVYNDQLYKCIGATSGAWDSSKWQLATLNDLLTDIEDAVAFVNDKANVDGNYPTMTVGVADQLSPYDDESGDDQDEPFSFQATGTGNGTQPDFATGAIALMKEKQGNTVVVNQLINPSNFAGSGSNNGITFTKNNNGSWTISGTLTDTTAQYSFIQLSAVTPVQNNHHYFAYLESCKSPLKLEFYSNTYGTTYGSNKKLMNVFKSTNTGQTWWNFKVSGEIGDTINETVFPRLCDITQWFNGDIPADLLAHPENFLRYYQGSLAYNTGELVNANGRYIKCIGMNQWDEVAESGRISGATGNDVSGNGIRSKNYILVAPNKQYYSKYGTYAGSSFIVYFYDKDKNYISNLDLYYTDGHTFTTPSNCCFIRFSVFTSSYVTYNHDISINLYYEDEARCLTYEPYEVLTNNDTGTEVLRSAGSVKDSKAPDGTITRRIGYVDLGSLSWTSTGSNNIFYATPTNMLSPATEADRLKGIICSEYTISSSSELNTNMTDKSCLRRAGNIYIRDTSFDDNQTSQLKTSLDGVYLFYELAEPTTEQGTSYSENLVIDDFGSMDFQGTNGVPQGNLIFYPVDYKAFIDTLYNYTEGTPSELALKSDISDTALNARGYYKQVDLSSEITDVAGLTYDFKKAYKIGNQVFLTIRAVNGTDSAITSTSTIFSLGSGLFNSSGGTWVPAIVGGNAAAVSIEYNGNVKTQSQINVNSVIFINVSYAVA